MAERIHLILCGERGVGKSTCIRRVIEETGLEVSGFITKSIPETKEGFHDIFIHPASQPEEERCRERINQIGSCNKVIHRINTDTFDTVGVKLLSGDPKELIVMDELGFMENEAYAFQDSVIRCLDGDIPVIAAIKPIVWSDFLNLIRRHDKVEVIPIYKHTRDEVYRYVLDRIRGITG